MKNIHSLGLTCFLLSSCATLPYEYQATDWLAESAEIANIADTSTTNSSCRFEKGKDRNLIISASIVLAPVPMKKGAVAINRGGNIADIGDFSDLTAKFPKASILNCPGAVISPSFVNAHEHAAFSYAFPDPLTGSKAFNHRDEWRGRIDGIKGLNIPKGLYTDDVVMTWVEIRHLLGGTTTIGGSGIAKGVIKNSSRNEGYQYRTEMKTFPFTPDASRFLKDYECNNTQQKLPDPEIKPDLTNLPYVPHVGEGINCIAALEVEAYVDFLDNNSGDRRQYSIIHAVNTTSKQRQRLIEHNIPLVWSPRSNVALYGKTAAVRDYKKSGGTVALATDWSPSGSFTMFEELSCAKSLSSTGNVDAFSDKEFWEMATINGAKALHAEDKIGSIKKGLKADLLIVPDDKSNPYSSVIGAGPESFLAVLINGKMLAASKDIGRNFKNCRYYAAAGKAICVKFSSKGFKYSEMVERNKNNVPIVGGYSRQASCKAS